MAGPVAIVAITRNGIAVGRRIRERFGSWTLFAPRKFDDNDTKTEWFDDPTSARMASIFRSHEALVCIFSLGAVIRLVAPHLGDKKTDPAVIVIDDKADFVISVLSGHLGGANQLSRDIAHCLAATPVITTAADVNKTIAVDLVGREFGWTISDDTHVTAVSAHMVNSDEVALYQEAGEAGWWKGPLPANVRKCTDMDMLRSSGARACLIISDRMVDTAGLPKCVTYRPKSLVVGVGLHQDTSERVIRDGIHDTLARHGLDICSVAALASIKKPQAPQGLVDLAKSMGLPVIYVEREKLALVDAPNPSDIVMGFEGTRSVSEAAAIITSGGRLVVEKQKFPPDLTIAVARKAYE